MTWVSRTEQPSWARELVKLLAIHHRFSCAEIYLSSQLTHYAALRELSGLESSSMVFFDDEMRNIKEVSSLRVSMVAIGNGTKEVWPKLGQLPLDALVVENGFRSSFEC